jgi:hypothetical protein
VHEDGTVPVNVAFEGPVFGWVTPYPRNYTGYFVEGGVEFHIQDDGVFGDVDVYLTHEGTITISGLQIPLQRVDGVVGAGEFDTESAHIDYQVNFLTRGGSQGTVDLIKVQ